MGGVIVRCMVGCLTWREVEVDINYYCFLQGFYKLIPA